MKTSITASSFVNPACVQENAQQPEVLLCDGRCRGDNQVVLSLVKLVRVVQCRLGDKQDQKKVLRQEHGEAL